MMKLKPKHKRTTAEEIAPFLAVVRKKRNAHKRLTRGGGKGVGLNTANVVDKTKAV